MDFEKMWQHKLSSQTEELCGREFRDEIMKGSEDLNADSMSADVIRWTAKAIEKLRNRLSPEEIHDIVTGCACHYPRAKLLPIRDSFRKSRDFAGAVSLLQKQFIQFLVSELQMDLEIVSEIIDMGMGPAGVLDGNRIIAVKIPKSEYLNAWLMEADPEKRRKLYCHCPRVRQSVLKGIEMPVEYCLCGAGYYRDIWETITEAPVRVEIIESIFAGGNRCSIAVYPSALKG